MAGDDEDLEKTEEPTSRRIEEAMKKGQVAFSREVVSFMLFVTLAIILVAFLPPYSKNAINFLQTFITSPEDIRISYSTFDDLMKDIVKKSTIIFFAPILLCVFMILIASLSQNGLIFSSEPLIPKLEKISVFKGLKKIFSMRSVVEFIKGVLKITALGYAVFLIFNDTKNIIIATPELGIDGVMEAFSSISFKIVIAGCILMLLVAATDFLYQRYEFMKSLRMTKQELKEEYKQTEGSPEIKAKLKQIRQERARRRMMASVPKADVVIRNPTHYAIALKYEQEDMTAPQVVALGQDLIALGIIRVAEENDVPIVTNRNLAKALYDTAELDEEIPLEHYKAVAEVIAYVYKLKNVKV
jgi:flagellar biosynthesis protein FlhB